ncbi:DUF6526 family protein [Edaphobacter bradus]|uniref:DUF6526 family protein n=1 Tax=Edaphobacter bradus TaxID=2259016 RepID=UPI0021DF52C3|nr:DUF6526 family protein [Edaphobacter bradus]
MAAEQNFKNHGRLDPATHFVIFPLFVLNFIFAIYTTIRHWPEHPHLHLWWIVISIALTVFVIRTRAQDLKLQDRVIRLEERLRLAALLPAADLAHVGELTCQQLIALRFASDAEIPALVHKTLTQGLEPKAIKESITNWRADYHRV